MFKILADESALLLISHKIIDEENRDAYTYGLELFFEKAFLYAIIFIIAIFTKTILFSIAFIVTYKALRQYTGGFHCKTAEMCLVISILIYLIALLIFLFKPRALELILATGTPVAGLQQLNAKFNFNSVFIGNFHNLNHRCGNLALFFKR